MADPRYALIQWEDRFMSIISLNEITSANKQPSEGELIKAYFGKQRKKEYEAVVCEIHANQKYLHGHLKLPPKYNFHDVKESNMATQKGNDDLTAEKRVNALWELQSSNDSISVSDHAKDSMPSCMSGSGNAAIPPSNASNTVELPSNSSSDNEEIPHFSPRRKSIRNCQSCIELKTEIEKLKQELASAKTMYGIMEGKPKAGIVSEEVAKKFGMIEIYPQSGVYWYKGQKEFVLFNTNQPEHLIGKTIDIFFERDILKSSSARGNGKYAPLTPTILDACLRFVQRVYEVDEASLIKVINDKCSHCRRGRRLGLYCREKYVQKKLEKKRKREQSKSEKMMKQQKKKSADIGNN